MPAAVIHTAPSKIAILSREPEILFCPFKTGVAFNNYIYFLSEVTSDMKDVHVVPVQ